jgi:hypothetical protein
MIAAYIAENPRYLESLRGEQTQLEFAGRKLQPYASMLESGKVWIASADALLTALELYAVREACALTNENC